MPEKQSTKNNMVLAQNIHVDQWGRTDNPDASLCNYSDFFFYKGVKSSYWRKKFLQQMVPGELAIYMQKDATGALDLSSRTKINSRMDQASRDKT